MVFIISGILCVPFFTMWERKVLRYIQKRKGPKKVSYLGILQPVADGIKLIIKNSGRPRSSNKFLFLFSPFLKFFLMLVLWVLYPNIKPTFNFKLGVILFLCISSLNVYTLIGRGWGRKSKYRLLGSVRGAAQTISYEVNLIILIFFPCCTGLSYSFTSKIYSNSFLILIFFPTLIVFWLMTLIAETNRAPFDFAEGERELVSGFKTEFSSVPFVFLFLAEYGKIIILSFFSSVLFFSLCILTYVQIVLISFFIMFFILWCRGSFPRFRYDFLMEISWKVILPVSFLFLFVSIL